MAECLLGPLPLPCKSLGCRSEYTQLLSPNPGSRWAMAKVLYKQVLAICEESCRVELGTEARSAQGWDCRAGSGQALSPSRLRFLLSITTGSSYFLDILKGDLCLSIFSSQSIQKIPFIKLPQDKSIKHNLCVLRALTGFFQNLASSRLFHKGSVSQSKIFLFLKEALLTIHSLPMVFALSQQQISLARNTFHQLCKQKLS